MAQVETHSAYRHSTQHSQYYYHSASPSHSTTSSPSNSHHSSPRNAQVHPQQYYSPSQCYSSEDKACHYRCYQPPRSPIGQQPDNSHASPFPAYDHSISRQTPTPEPIEAEEEEEDYDELEDDTVDSGSLKSASASTVFAHISDDIWTERGPAPSRQVDYLSHDWQEPDIWSSWRYIRKEKAGYPQNAARLENASWRTWAKSKYKLKTISPETLNWLKDCDVTWLYGPLQPQATRAYTEPTSPALSVLSTPRREMSRSSSFTSPSKPILKKRSHSEVMLTSFAGTIQGNLLTRAAQAVQDERRREMEEKEFREEQRKNPLTPSHVLRSQQRIRRSGSSDLQSLARDSPESPVTTNQNGLPPRTDYFGGNWISSASGGQTPSASKHIHFNELVQQCIVVNVKDDEDISAIDGNESEDEALFMKSRHSPKVEHSTIARLPATLLRPGDDPIGDTIQITFDLGSTHEETSETSGFYYEEGGGFSSSASPPEFPPRFNGDPIEEFCFETIESTSDNIGSNTTSTSSSPQSSDFDLEEESAKRASVSAIPIPIVRSASQRDRGGMMGEDDDEGTGIVGLAADAISTAKDLVGVLWNAGWGARR